MGEKLFALEELLWNGGDVAPGSQIFRCDPVREAEAAVGRHLRDLPGEKFPRELVPFGLVDRAKQLPGPCPTTGRLGEIEWMLLRGRSK